MLKITYFAAKNIMLPSAGNKRCLIDMLKKAYSGMIKTGGDNGFIRFSK
jgi:hypothetical protein